MSNLDSLIDGYLKTKKHQMESELSFFRRLRLPFAIEEAVKARGENGKMLNHQHRVGAEVLARAYERIQPFTSQMEVCESFSILLDLICKVTEDIPRFGELAAYDTALRIGAKIEKMPLHVYLHAGTRAGAKRLGFDTTREYLSLADIEALHPELLRLGPSHHIENFLCCSVNDFVE